MDKREEIGQEWLKTLLRGKKLAKRDENGRKMTQKGANHGSPAYATGQSNHYNSNHDHLRVYYLRRRNAGKESR